MTFAISTPTSSLLHSSSSTGVKTSSLFASSNSVLPIPKNAIFQQIKCIPHLGFGPFSQWNGLRHMGISISQYSVKMVRKGKCKSKGVYASLFGVGAPEALVIGVVALLVFGPKGLAEVARNLGKTLRAFQPTIRELQEVSREFKTTLEREIGLDDIDTPVSKRPSPSPSSDSTKPTPEDKPNEDSGTNIEPNGSPAKNGEESKDDYVKVRADQLTSALARLQKEQEEEAKERENEAKETEKENESKEMENENEAKERVEIQSESLTPSQDTPQAIDTVQKAPPVAPSSQNPDNSALQEAAPVVSKGPAEKPESET